MVSEKENENASGAEDATPAILGVEDFWELTNEGLAAESSERLRSIMNEEPTSFGGTRDDNQCNTLASGSVRRSMKNIISLRSERSASSTQNSSADCSTFSDNPEMAQKEDDEAPRLCKDTKLPSPLPDEEVNCSGSVEQPGPPRLMRNHGSSWSARRAQQQPGVVYVERSQAGRAGENNSLQDSMTNTIQESAITGDDDVLVEAQVVSPNLLATATPDPWWRRHQWWLAGAAVIVIVGAVLSVVLTTVELGAEQQQTTAAPTTISEGIEAQTSELIVSALPSSAALLADESTSQYQALQWVMQQRLDNDDYSETKMLQHYSLAALFLSTNDGGNSWRRSGGWLNSTAPCDWYGVECIHDESEDIIVGLNLTANGLSGPLVPDVSILGQTLRRLDLSHNDLTGSLSTELGQMNLLTYLTLEKNSLSGSIPSSFASLTHLAILDLSSNNLASTIPPELGTLKALEELMLGENDFIGEVPASFGSLSQLVHLNVSDNRLSQPLPTELGRLNHLKILAAQSNLLLGPLPTELGLLSSLETLMLSNNYIFNRIPTEVGLLADLKMLDISHNLFTGTIPYSSIAPLRQLSTLKLQGNFIEGSLQGNSEEELRAGEILGGALQELDRIEVLDLSSNFLVGVLPSQIWSLPNLRHLNASRNSFLNPPFVDADFMGSASLQVLDLSHNFLGPEGLNSTITRSSSNLTSLDVSNNFFQSPIPTEVGLLTQLTYMDLSMNQLQGSAPLELLSLTELQSLNLAQTRLDCTDVFPDVLGLSSLTELRLSHSLLSGSIPSIIGIMTSLEVLQLDNTGLYGVIPSEVGLLTELGDFNVGFNVVSGTIPPEFGRMLQLTNLEVSSNSLVGTVPMEISFLAQLQHLGVFNNQLFGAIPTEIGMLSRMTALELFANNFSGMIPSEVGLLTALVDLALSYNWLTGSIPTTLGQLNVLTRLHLNSNVLSGELPSEVGLTPMLETLLLGDNHILRGTIPQEVWLLSNLFHLDVAGNQFVGSLPSEIGLLSQLHVLKASDNLLTGSLPSEAGLMDQLLQFHLANNPLSGSIPDELGTAPWDLIGLNIAGTEITGSIPEELCRRMAGQFANHEFGRYGLTAADVGATVDCNHVTCNCCNCPTSMPSVSPSSTFLPSRTPSTSTAPSGSLEPTLVPSLSLEPSVSLLPSQTELACSTFSSIAAFGVPLGISGKDEGVEEVNLPFSFNWRGQVEYSVASVSTNGVVFLGDNVFDSGCCGPESAIALGGHYTTPRIAVAHSDMGPSGFIYTAHVDDAFVISWEGVSNFIFPQNLLDFQLLLFENGNVEFRWGDGINVSAIFAAGLEDDLAGMALTLEGQRFENVIPKSGFFADWPRQLCRKLVVSPPGGYIEVKP